MTDNRWSQATRLERKFLRFLAAKETEWLSGVDIEPFMVSNFKKPDPITQTTRNDNDKGVIFLKTLKAKGFIDYDDEALAHVNKWTLEGGADGKTKRWFDTLHKPLLVYRILRFGEFPLSSRLLNKRFVLKQIKYAIRLAIKYGIKLLIAVWKYLIALSLVVIGVYLENGKLDKIWIWLKSIF